MADTLYLQTNYFDEDLCFNQSVKPYLQLTDKHSRHLLQEGDLLFAAKGFNNFAVEYRSSIGQAVAASSFIVIRLTVDNILPEYLAWPDWKQWKPIQEWLGSRRSQPAA